MTATFKLISAPMRFPLSCAHTTLSPGAIAPEYRSLSSTIWEKIGISCDNCCPSDYDEGKGRAVVQRNVKYFSFSSPINAMHTV